MSPGLIDAENRLVPLSIVVQVAAAEAKAALAAVGVVGGLVKTTSTYGLQIIPSVKSDKVKWPLRLL